MIAAVQSDIALQIAMFAIALGFAFWASWRSTGSKQGVFMMAVLQALVFEASIVVLAGAAFPHVFESALNHQGFIALVAMMTLIYSTRDLFENIQGWRDNNNSSLHKKVRR